MNAVSYGVVSLFFSSFLLLPHTAFSQKIASSEREALEIIIGGGGENGNYSPSPSPSPSAPAADCPPPPPPSRLEKARRVLLKFAASIDDPNCFTKNWNGPNPCNYKGVRCEHFPNSNERAVSGLDFNQAGFSGLKGSRLILTEILRIPELTFFHVNSNNFSGSIPLEITKYQYFYELDLSNNKLTGTFPVEVLASKQLVFLDLRFNSLTGSVPPLLFQLDLDVIFINNNNFYNSLPSNFGATPARFLTFANNKLTGPIPRSIGKASNTLTEVLFLNNQFSGCLPYEIGYLKKATVFDVSNNWLTGPIPCSFACLENIQFLNLAQNKFYGSVPEPVCELSGIRNNGNLTLRGNYFTEIGPECRKLLKTKVLDVDQNCIPGLPNQKSKQECYAFFKWVKPCPNPLSLLYLPCKKKYYSKPETTSSIPSAPVTYQYLNPTPQHRVP